MDTTTVYETRSRSEDLISDFHSIHPIHRQLHDFVLEQCEVYYLNHPITNEREKFSEIIYAMKVVACYDGDVEILKLRCLLPLYTKELIRDLVTTAIWKNRCDIVQYIITLPNYYPTCGSITYAIHENQEKIAVLLRGNTQSFQQGHYRMNWNEPHSLCEEPSTCTCLSHLTDTNWEILEQCYL